MTQPPTPHQQQLRQQAEFHAGRKEWDKAHAGFLALAAERPGDAGPLIQLSYVESLRGHYRAARDYALAADRLQSMDPEVLHELFSRLRTFNAIPELHACIARLRPLSRVPIKVLLGAAAQCSYLNEQDMALELLDEARRADPGFPPTLIARSQVLTFLGRFDEAEADVRRGLQLAPEIPHGWSVLAKLRKQTPDRNCVAQIQQQLQRPKRPPAQVAILEEALHKTFDDLGEHAKAWDALVRMCRAKRATLHYSMEETRRLVEALEQLPTTPAANAPQDGPTPIFIVGMHRSGTTLLEQLLDGHSDVRGVGELYDVTSQMRYATDHHCKGVIDATIVERSKDVDFAAVGRGYLDALAWRLGTERFFTDKLPSNFLNIGFICRALPNAKILHMVRDPVETCFSNLRELFSDANPYTYDQRELADFHAQYRRLMAHWHRAYPGRILDVDYASLTRDTEAVLREVSAFCGFAFEPEMLALENRTRGVATASAVQVRNKVEVRAQPKWKPYEAFLQPLIQALRSG